MDDGCKKLYFYKPFYLTTLYLFVQIVKKDLQTPPPTSPTSFYETVAHNTSISPGPGTSHDDLLRLHGTKSPSVIFDTAEDGKASPIHAEIKLLVRTSENGRESVEIRSLKEVVVPPSASPIPSSHISSSPQSPKRGTLSPTDSTKILLSEDDLSDRVDSPILTQKLVVRFQEGDLSM